MPQPTGITQFIFGRPLKIAQAPYIHPRLSSSLLLTDLPLQLVEVVAEFFIGQLGEELAELQPHRDRRFRGQTAGKCLTLMRIDRLYSAPS